MAVGVDVAHAVDDRPHFLKIGGPLDRPVGDRGQDRIRGRSNDRRVGTAGPHDEAKNRDSEGKKAEGGRHRAIIRSGLPSPLSPPFAGAPVPAGG